MIISFFQATVCRNTSCQPIKVRLRLVYNANVFGRYSRRVVNDREYLSRLRRLKALCANNNADSTLGNNGNAVGEALRLNKSFDIRLVLNIKGNLGIGKGGKARFKEHIKLFDINDGTKQLSGQALYKANVMIQRQRIKAMQEFLAAESSTLGQSRSGPKTIGIKKIYENRAKTITNKFLDKYGLEMSENDLKRFFDSKKQAKLEKIVGSKQMFVVASVIKKLNIRGSRKELEKFVKSHVDLNQYKDDAPDLNMSAKESRAQYLERLRDHMQYTNDPVLNDMVTNALKEGINAKNIFI